MRFAVLQNNDTWRIVGAPIGRHLVGFGLVNCQQLAAIDSSCIYIDLFMEILHIKIILFMPKFCPRTTDALRRFRKDESQQQHVTRKRTGWELNPPATCQSQVQSPTAAPPRNTTLQPITASVQCVLLWPSQMPGVVFSRPTGRSLCQQSPVQSQPTPQPVAPRCHENCKWSQQH